MGSIRSAACLAIIGILAVYLLGAGASAQSVPTGITPMPIPTLSPQEFTLYANKPIVELCNSTARTLRDLEAIEMLQLGPICAKQQSGAGILGAGIYGYQHPAPTTCNAGNGLRTGLLGLVTGKSPGNVNIISGVGMLLGILFAGCNNAPVQGDTANNRPALLSSAPSPLSGIPASISLTSGKVITQAISEANYSGTFAFASADPSIATVSPSSGSPSTPGSVVEFSIQGVGAAGKSTTITIKDVNGNVAQIAVNIAP